MNIMKKNSMSTFLWGVAFLCVNIFWQSPLLAVGGIGGYPEKPLNPDHKSWFMYQLKPGESYEDVIVVKNTTDKEWIVDLYPADSAPSSGGGFALKQKVEDMTQMGSWIKLSSNEVLLGAGETKKVPFEISIPPDVEIGEFSGGIMMEKIDPIEKEVARKNMGSGIRLSIRTGVRVYNVVPGDVKRELIVKDGVAALREKRDGEKFFVVTVPVENTGNISTYAKFITKARDLWSGEVVFDNSDKPSSYLVSPSTIFDYNQEITVPKFRNLNVNFAHMEVETQVFMVIGKEEVLLDTHVYTEEIIPIKEIAYLVAGVIAFIVFVILIIVLHKIKYSGKGWKTYAVKQGDTIVSLADKYGIKWKFLAKVNKLDSPYIISKGDEILVPPQKK